MDFLDLDLDFVYVSIAGRVLSRFHHGLHHHEVVDLLGFGILEVELGLAGRECIGRDCRSDGVDPQVGIV